MQYKGQIQKLHDAELIGNENLPITPRAFNAQQPAKSNRHWVRQDPVATALFNAFSVVFPIGETFMVRSIKPWQKRMPKKLAQDVRNFAEQEAAHAREHGNMNQSLIDAGYDIAPLENVIKGFVSIFRNSSDLTSLGVTMSIEHFTSIIAAEILKNDHHLDGADPEMHALWIWHAIEEVEHKAVAFDVWQHATRNWSAPCAYMARCGLLILISISFLINRTRGQMQLLQQDGYGRLSAFKKLFAYGFGKNGLGRNILKSWADFFRPGFHPWDHDDRDYIAKGEAMLAEMQRIRATSSRPAEPRKNMRYAKAA